MSTISSYQTPVVSIVSPPSLQRELWSIPREDVPFNYVVCVYFQLYFKSLTRQSLSDFTIRSPPPLLKLLRHPSRLVLKFSLNGIDEQMLSTRRGAENGIWKLDGDVKM